ncbi:MAG: peptide deformylase, partial [Candidatus Nealsonbacteria bacterium]|nr:peptide deformylase [Candidatus Nealsonbacteria bacterium]
DPILRQKAREVKKIDEEILKLGEDMIETMIDHNGIGLAANQVGVLKRIITIRLDFKKQEFLALVNPKITKKSKETSPLEEGCLSFPNIFIEIRRPRKIEVEGLTLNGVKVKLEAEGVLSHVFQHEIDHLDGKPFYTRLPIIKKIKFKFKNKWA